jgi:hypothetical protein
VDAEWAAGERTVAGVVAETPRIKLYLAGRSASPDWCRKSPRNNLRFMR